MTGLKKELGLLSVFSIAAGAMISSGLFILPGLAYFKSGPAVILAYLLAGILVLPSMFSKAELATAMPNRVEIISLSIVVWERDLERSLEFLPGSH